MAVTEVRPITILVTRTERYEGALIDSFARASFEIENGVLYIKRDMKIIKVYSRRAWMEIDFRSA